VGRWFTLAAAVLSAAIFIVVRNTLDLEDSRFVIALLACSTLAMALSLAVGPLFRGWTRSSLLPAVAAFVLVPLLYVAYLVLFVVIVCGIVGETCYS
jgi:hypothetical protein